MNFSIFNEFILAVTLGLVQGITEFLPISSTAHIRIVTSLLTQNRDIGLVASNIIQLGTTVALVQIFWPELKKYVLRLKEVLFSPESRANFSKSYFFWQKYSKEAGQNQALETLDQRYAKELANPITTLDVDILKIIIGTLPILVLGLFFSSFAESQAARSLQFIGVFLIIGSVLMFVAEKIYLKAKVFAKPKIWTVGESVLVGLFQFLAIFPGMSRSGSTISGALFLGRDRSESVRFSFLVSIPTILIAGLYGVFKLVRELIKNQNLHFLPNPQGWSGDNINLSVASVLVALLCSYIFGFLTLKWLIKFLSTNTFIPFVIYRIILGLLLIFATGIFK